MCEEDVISKHIKTFHGTLRGVATRSPWPSDSLSLSTNQHKSVITRLILRLEQIMISKYTELIVTG